VVGLIDAIKLICDPSIVNLKKGITKTDKDKVPKEFLNGIENTIDNSCTHLAHIYHQTEKGEIISVSSLREKVSKYIYGQLGLKEKQEEEPDNLYK